VEGIVGALRQGAKNAAERVNLDVHRRDLAHPARRMAAMRVRGIDAVLDVGANHGQYVEWLRRSGYHGAILSFEPIPHVFRSLQLRCGADVSWRGVQAAVGAQSGRLTLNVSEDSVTSSFLAARSELTSRIPSARAVDVVEVDVTTVDKVMSSPALAGRRVMLKIDVQGFEHAVLDGASESLGEIELVEIEMGLTTLYEGGSTIYDLLPRLRGENFGIISLDAGYVDKETGQVLDLDMLLGRVPSQASDRAIPGVHE